MVGLKSPDLNPLFNHLETKISVCISDIQFFQDICEYLISFDNDLKLQEAIVTKHARSAGIIIISAYK